MIIASRIKILSFIVAIGACTNCWAIAVVCENEVKFVDGPGPHKHITSSGIHNDNDDFSPWKAFDGVTTGDSMWISRSGQFAWLAYQFPVAKKIDHYTIYFANGDTNGLAQRAPRDWELQGFKDGKWITLDRRTGEVRWSGREQRSFDVGNPGFYERYRLYVEEDNYAKAGIEALSISQLALEACGCYKNDELVPVLAGDVPQVESSEHHSEKHEPWQAFDNALSTIWEATGDPGAVWISYRWEAPQFVNEYSMTYSYEDKGLHAPSAWSLQGYDGRAWQTLDYRSDQTGWGQYQTHTYTVEKPGYYSAYRLMIEAGYDTTDATVSIALSNISFKGCSDFIIPKQ